MANWYLQNGKDSDVVVSSRVRLVRNLNGFKFLSKCSKEEQEKIGEYFSNLDHLITLHQRQHKLHLNALL